MDQFSKPSPLITKGNMPKNWKDFKQRSDIYLSAIGADDKPVKQQANMFLNVLGEEALEIYNGFEWDAADDKMKRNKIEAKFEKYCENYVN